MRHSLFGCVVVCLGAVLARPTDARAELKELEVHGQIRIGAHLFTPGFGDQGDTVGFNDSKSNDDFYNALAEVNVITRFNRTATGVIGLRSYDIWGGRCCPPPTTMTAGGAPVDTDDSGRGNDTAFLSLQQVAGEGGLFTTRFADDGNDAVGMYQAYIQIDQEIASNLMVRLGRQEIALGREFLVGNNDAGVNFAGHAFDAIRTTYDDEHSYQVTAFLSKLLEFRSTEQDADVDFYGVYGTYYGLEHVDLDLYWLWLHNGIGNNVVGPAPPAGSEAEDIHTFGGRVYGTALEDQLTYNVEVAYQMGEVNNTPLLALNPSGTTAPLGLPATGSSDVEAWAINALVGYTFANTRYTPEVHAEYAYFSGDDDPTDGDYEQFTRLFSDVHYGRINLGGDFDENLTNVHVFRLGGSLEPAERLRVNLDYYYFLLAEDDISALTGAGAFTLGRNQTLAVSSSGDDELGHEVDLWAQYQYSQDLVLSAGWSHFFTGDAVTNAFSTTAARAANDDLDYFWWEAHLVF